jgi:uncharacterized protein (UPF0332 family)
LKDENRSKNRDEEMAHAEEALKAGHILMEHGLFREALPKLYYALFHAMRALLFTKGLEPKSHEGVTHLFNLHFVKPGLFSDERNRFFKRLMKYRHEAEYGLGSEIREKDCEEWHREVSRAIDEIKEFMHSESR